MESLPKEEQTQKTSIPGGKLYLETSEENIYFGLDLFTFYEFKDILELSKDVPSLKKAIDNLRLIYYTVKDAK